MVPATASPPRRRIVLRVAFLPRRRRGTAPTDRRIDWHRRRVFPDHARPASRRSGRIPTRARARLAPTEQPAELHDLALFSRTERFTQPRLVASLAGIVLGQLNGQEGWDNVSYTLHCAKPTSGQSHGAAMLREWTRSSYTTRDYRNLAEPLVIVEAEDAANKLEETATPPPSVATPTAAKPIGKPAAKTAGKKPISSSAKPKSRK